MKTSATLSTLFIISTALVACGSDPKPVPNTAASFNNSDNSRQLTKSSKSDDKGTTGMVSISDDVKTACGLTDDEAYFAFNSAAVRPKDREILDKLAACFTSGKLKGRTMQLVGHADPRGDDDYNLALGGKRADSVKDVIVTRGMPAGRVVTSSRGEMDATGTDESTWAKDRRVDVLTGS